MRIQNWRESPQIKYLNNLLMALNMTKIFVQNNFYLNQSLLI